AERTAEPCGARERDEVRGIDRGRLAIGARRLFDGGELRLPDPADAAPDLRDLGGRGAGLDEIAERALVGLDGIVEIERVRRQLGGRGAGDESALGAGGERLVVRLVARDALELVGG